MKHKAILHNLAVHDLSKKACFPHGRTAVTTLYYTMQI